SDRNILRKSHRAVIHVHVSASLLYQTADTEMRRRGLTPITASIAVPAAAAVENSCAIEVPCSLRPASCHVSIAALGADQHSDSATQAVAAVRIEIEISETEPLRLRRTSGPGLRSVWFRVVRVAPVLRGKDA